LCGSGALDDSGYGGGNPLNRLKPLDLVRGLPFSREVVGANPHIAT